MTGAAGAVLAANLIAMAVQVVVARKVIRLPIMGYLNSWLGGAIVGIIAWLFIQVFDVFVPDMPLYIT